MFTNYSQTYAATITTFAGLIGLFVNKFGYTNSDVELALSASFSLVGIIWQLVHRHSKGDVSPLGVKKV